MGGIRMTKEESLYKMEEVHISQIKVGDAILHNGAVRTVCKRFLTYCSFMGVSVFGDNYRSGHRPVKRVIF